MVKKNDSSWNGPQGSNDLGKDKLVRQPDKGYPKPRDISKKVDANWKVNDGFSGRLTSED
jgi:hypothetical protein